MYYKVLYFHFNIVLHRVRKWAWDEEMPSFKAFTLSYNTSKLQEFVHCLKVQIQCLPICPLGLHSGWYKQNCSWNKNIAHSDPEETFPCAPNMQPLFVLQQWVWGINSATATRLGTLWEINTGKGVKQNTTGYWKKAMQVCHATPTQS